MRDEKKKYEILKKYWGYDTFRPKQAEVIQAAIEGRDSLVLFPTGGGKSLCFQVPVLCMEGIGIVVSPLIALMMDQVEHLKSKGVKAEYLHSGMHYYEMDRILDNCIYGDVKLLYISPERLRQDEANQRLRQMQINLWAIDEAHCISQWGHDFRPAYRLIGEVREWSDAPMMALTASATMEVVKDIGNELGLKDPETFRRSFFRSNLNVICEQREDKMGRTEKILERMQAPSILYTRSRAATEDISTKLIEAGIPASYYHAGLTTEKRSNVQRQWLENKTKTVVCTNAFGMGVDKSDVRLVLHQDIPPSIEEYYQEIGRAGRDGADSYCVMLYNGNDVQRLQKQLKMELPDEQACHHVYACLGRYFDLAVGSGEGESFDFDLQSFCSRFNLNVNATQIILKILEQNAWITISDAFYQPSKVMILADKDDLYTYQIKNKAADILLRLMLRTYEGLFSNFVRISERLLASKLNTSVGKVKQVLEQLAADDVLEYDEARDVASITYLLPRSTKANFRIDPILMERRRQRLEQKLDGMISYLNEEVCRMRNIVTYFGEKYDEVCGKCDLCRASRKLNEEEHYDQIKRIILQAINPSISVAKAIELFSSNRKEEVLQGIERLIQEKWIVRNHNELELHPSKKLNK